MMEKRLEIPIAEMATGFCRCRECGQTFIYSYVIENGKQVTNPTCIYCGYDKVVSAINKSEVTPDDLVTVTNMIDKLEDEKALRRGISRPADGSLIEDEDLPF
jgi:hypothetical protein